MTPTRLIDTEKSRIKNLVDGRHILGIQDTTEINYQAHNGFMCGHTNYAINRWT